MDWVLSALNPCSSRAQKNSILSQKTSLLRADLWLLLGREAVCGSLAGENGFPSWELFVASKGKYARCQINPDPYGYVVEDHVQHAVVMEESYMNGGDTRLEARYSELECEPMEVQPSPRLRPLLRMSGGSTHKWIWVPGGCRICVGTPADAEFGCPRFLVYMDDTRGETSSSGFDAKLRGKTRGCSFTATFSGDSSFSSERKAGTTTVNVDVTLPMAKLTLDRKPNTQRRYITSVIVGISLKLKGTYRQRGREVEHSASAASLSGGWGVGASAGAEASSNSSHTKAASATAWKIVESKGLKINVDDLPSAAEPEKVQDYIYKLLEGARDEPERWATLFLDVNSDDFLTIEEHRTIEQLPARAVAYFYPEQFPEPVTSLTNPLIKEVLRCLHGMEQLSLTPSRVPVDAASDVFEQCRSLVDSMSPQELQLEDASYNFIKDFSYFNDEEYPELTSKACKFWWGHLRLEIGESLCPVLPSGAAGRSRILNGVMQAHPDQRPFRPLKQAESDSDSDRPCLGAPA